jgi:hypothetical protein
MACQEVNWWVSVTGQLVPRVVRQESILDISAFEDETNVSSWNTGNQVPNERVVKPQKNRNPLLHHHCENPIIHKLQVPKYSTFYCGGMKSYTLPPTFSLQARAATEAKYCTAVLYCCHKFSWCLHLLRYPSSLIAFHSKRYFYGSKAIHCHWKQWNVFRSSRKVSNSFAWF